MQLPAGRERLGYPERPEPGPGNRGAACETCRWPGLLEGYENSANFLVSLDGHYLITAHGEKAFVWDLHRGGTPRTLSGHTGLLQSIGFTPDSRQAITVGAKDSTVRLWRLPTA